ncbi:AarF/ABC1/UbiB kinase family protein [Magnetospira sp. QH-2]|uniref:ABC1 kinase family protein n=1 Tax=Magnetospira sp. (strain QH-2) TaxID=1288970 RepID=UPI0003E81BDA|nr:AarF/ABC1/UbiB kinase family protein [Magnetospira sp. QH-2]CCQ74093.1 Conserved protein of unknown function [Magnetospira sp. QH-2]
MARTPEQDNLGRRVQRYAKVGGAVGGMAAKMAGKKIFGIQTDQSIHAAELTAALGGLKGPLMKVAQILTTIPDALPEEYALQLAQLQSNAPAMGWPFVKRRMAAELGRDWQNSYASFTREAVSAASLGQVHRATDEQGRAMACKLQYPDMASVVEADLKQLKLVLGIYHRYDKALDSSNIHAELSERLREELDYRRESRHMRLYQAMLAEEPGVQVPEPVDGLTTDRLLTMSWLDGEPLLSFTKHHQDMRNTLAYNMFRAWYVPFYEYGVIHGDPHLGNYTVRPDGTVNLLDFGCIRVFEPSFVEGVINLYKALRDDDPALAVHAYETWGFKDLRSEVIDVLNLWANFVYAPLMEDRSRRIQETNSGVYGAEVAAKVHRELRRVGGVKPPREFVLMDRAAIGLGSVFLHLKAEINWYQLFHELIGDFDVGELARRQAKALTAASL